MPPSELRRKNEGLHLPSLLTMTRTMAVLLTCVGLMACAGEEPPPMGEDLSSSVSQAITNGDAVESRADNAVVALITSDGEATCTGIVIGPYAVATAAHCLRPIAPLRVSFGATPGKGIEIDVVETRVHLDYDEETLTADIGIVGLAERAPAKPVPLYEDDLDAETLASLPLRIVGFGATSGFSGGSKPKKREGMAKIKSVGSDSFRLEPSPSQTCNGDSGGPAFVTINKKEVLLGITSAGDLECKVYGRSTRVDAYADFLNDQKEAYALRAKTNQLVSQNRGCSTSPRTYAFQLEPLLALAAVALVVFARRSTGSSRSESHLPQSGNADRNPCVRRCEARVRRT